MLVDGKKIAAIILGQLAVEVKALKKPPRLTAVLVGPDSEAGQLSKKFLLFKQKAAEQAGINFQLYELSEKLTTEELCAEVSKISEAEENDGVLVELPLPKHIDRQLVLDAVAWEKDVDVLSSQGQTAYYSNQSAILPPAVEAVKAIFEEYKVELKDKACAVFGSGLLVGRPVAHWLKQQGAKVLIVDEFTGAPEQISITADIIITGVGPIRKSVTSNGVKQTHLITADMIKAGVVVIDFGSDVDFEAVSQKASLITPPTGGVGPIVVASVLRNLLILQKTA